MKDTLIGCLIVGVFTILAGLMHDFGGLSYEQVIITLLALIISNQIRAEVYK